MAGLEGVLGGGIAAGTLGLIRVWQHGRVTRQAQGDSWDVLPSLQCGGEQVLQITACVLVQGMNDGAVMHQQQQQHWVLVVTFT